MFCWRVLLAVALLSRAPPCVADLYMNNPRGSNNKLNEVSDNVRNDNRLFDSQNNAAAGYQVGDNCDGSCAMDTNNDNNAAPDTYDASMPGAGQGMMYYYATSLLPIEWTAQHGCGTIDQSNNCEVIIQYMCEDTAPGLRDGTRRATIGGGHNDNGGNTPNRPDGTSERTLPDPSKARDKQYGQHETMDYWYMCKGRERNKGLFTANKLQSTTRQQTAIYTRQGDNGERYGFECPEERDYYPYWHPSPWRDIAVLTDDTSRCEYYRRESQNVVDKGYCRVANYNCSAQTSCKFQRYNENNRPEYNMPPLPNNRVACEDWNKAYPQFPAKWSESGDRHMWPPECKAPPFQRQNHHGNDLNGYPASYDWRIPNWLGSPEYDEVVDKKCVLRLRYNMSSADFDGWATFAKDNKVILPDPYKDWLGQGYNISGPLQLNINTAQFSRVFEDRSHAFMVKPRPPTIPFYATIYNFNVRGRRGNIVDVYPAVEYDFVWSNMYSSVNRWDFLHMQWTGSDANQAGNAGNGMQMTDRSNFIEISHRNMNTPKVMFEGDFYEKDWFGETITNEDGTVRTRKIDLWKSMLPDVETMNSLAHLRQTNCVSPEVLKTRHPNNAQRRENDRQNCAFLNRAPAYFDGGLVQLTKTGTYHFMSTRNNAFSNRGQKGTITIVENVYLILFVTATMGIATALAFGGWQCHKNLPGIIAANPNGCLAATWCGKRALAHQALEAEAESVKKRSFLKRVDSVHPEIHVTSEDGDVEDLEEAATVNKKDGSIRKLKKQTLGRCAKWWAYSSQTVKWSIGFFIINILFGIYGLSKAMMAKPYMPTSYFFAKAGGGMLNFNCSIILVPVLRNLLSWLRTTPIATLVPLDDNIILHKVVFVGILASATMHTVCHYFTYADPTYESSGGSTLYAAFTTFHGLTGHCILFMMLAMMITALECCRRKTHKLCCCTVGGYSMFWNVHKLWMPCMLLLLFHGQNFWSYVTWPLILTLLEKLIQKYRAKESVELVTARTLPSDVMSIQFCLAHGKKFKYQAGQYIYINCPAVSESEWHPFTLSSAPEDEFLSCHIRCTKQMDWCYAFRRKINPNDTKVLQFETDNLKHTRNPLSDRGPRLPQPTQIKIDGPYGSASEEVFQYERLVLVGAGIGVTPFSSIMRSMVLKQKQNAAVGIQRPIPVTDFYWLCRSRWEFDAFQRLMRSEISENRALKEYFNFNLYMSGETEISDKGFQRELEDYGQWASLYTGRPKWDRIFQGVRKDSLKTHHKEIGVFLCGPPAIAVQLETCSKKYSDDRIANRREGVTDGTYFTFHQEHF